MGSTLLSPLFSGKLARHAPLPRLPKAEGCSNMRTTSLLCSDGFSDICILLFLFLSLCRFCLFVFLFCSHWSLVDVPLISFCPADHVPDWQPRLVLGMVEARSVNVKKTTTALRTGLVCLRPWRHFFLLLFSLISLIADGPHHYHPACGH